MHALTGLKSLWLYSQRHTIKRASQTAARLAPCPRQISSTATARWQVASAQCSAQQRLSALDDGVLRAMVAEGGASAAGAKAQAPQRHALPAADMKLDRSAFTEEVKLKALRVPTARCQELMKRFTGCASPQKVTCRRARGCASFKRQYT